MSNKWNRLSLCGVLVVLLAVTAPGCSSTKKSADDDDAQASVDAGTDAVPSADAETGAAPTTQAASDTATPDATSPDASPGRISADATDAPTTTAEATPPATTSTEASAPVAPATDTTAVASSTGSSESYTVHSGDTLMRIAFEHYGDLYKWREIYEANRDKIKNPNLIYSGTVLTINGGSQSQASVPGGEKYLVKSGDTLGTIAKNVYGATDKWKELWKYNQSEIQDPNKIFAGFFVYYSKAVADEAVPAAPVAAAQTAPQPVAVAAVTVPQAAPAPAAAAPTTGNAQRAPASETEKK